MLEQARSVRVSSSIDKEDEHGNTVKIAAPYDADCIKYTILCLQKNCGYLERSIRKLRAKLTTIFGEEKDCEITFLVQETRFQRRSRLLQTSKAHAKGHNAKCRLS